MTEGLLIVKMEAPIKIPFSRIEDVNVNFKFTDYPVTVDEGMIITFLDHQNEKHKISLYIEKYSENELQMAIYRQMIGRYVKVANARLGNTAFEKFLFKVNEFFRDKLRDKLCTRLQKRGIDAQMAVRGRFEEDIRDFALHSGGYSLGIIRISEGPINWINIRKVTGEGKNDSKLAYIFDYGIADPKLVPGVSEPRYHFANFQWEGEDYNTGIIDRLNNDDSLRETFLEGIRIAAIGNYGCWIISKRQVTTYSEPLIRSVNFILDRISAERQSRQYNRIVPTGDEWNCYRVIAQHLLAKWCD